MTGETRCPVCGSKSASNSRPCPVCEEEMLSGTGSNCSLCGIDLAGTGNPCPACRDAVTPLDDVVAMGPWSGALREWLSLLKFGGDKRLSQWTAEVLAQIVLQRWPHSTIVPVPPRRRRLLMEGYDAVGTIARAMSKQGVRVVEPLRRIGSATQKSLGREERLLAGALKFGLKGHFPEGLKEAVLLDDVSTTGSTLRVCAGLLKSYGVDLVHGLVICKD